MTKEELELIRSQVLSGIPMCITKCTVCDPKKEALRIIDRELKLKDLDPRS